MQAYEWVVCMFAFESTWRVSAALCGSNVSLRVNQLALINAMLFFFFFLWLLFFFFSPPSPAPFVCAAAGWRDWLFFCVTGTAIAESTTYMAAPFFFSVAVSPTSPRLFLSALFFLKDALLLPAARGEESNWRDSSYLAHKSRWGCHHFVKGAVLSLLFVFFSRPKTLSFWKRPQESLSLAIKQKKKNGVKASSLLLAKHK